MSLKVNNDLHFINSDPAKNVNKKIEVFDIGNFQLDQDVTISSKEMEILPHNYKADIRNIFLKVINKNKVQKEIEEKNATSISLKVIDGKLVYKLDSSKNYQNVQDEKIQKAFQKIAKNIKSYLNNVGALKEKQTAISKVDKDIIQTSPKDVEKISKEILRKMKKSDTEWSLWAVWACSLRKAFQKICVFLDIKINWKVIPPGIDDTLAYLFAFFGILNGIEIQRDSKKIGDLEGQKDGRYKILRNALAIIGSTFDFIGKTFAIAYGVLMTIILSIVASSILTVVTILASLKYLYLAVHANRFKNKFTKYTENEKLNQKQRIEAALKFLKSKVSVTEQEACKIIDKVRKQNKTVSDYKIKKIAHEEIAKKLLTKIKRFERRVGSGIVGPIQENVDKILQDLQDPKNIKKAQIILEKVKSKNNLTIQENKWYLIATLLQTLEIVLLIVFGFTALAALMGGLSSVIVVVIIAAYLYRKHIQKEKDLDKCILDENLKFLAEPAI